MEEIHAPSMSERQVKLYAADSQEPFRTTMEEIKISIVNDRAIGTKQKREEVTVVSPCAKRLCHPAFSCSTPSSAQVCATQLSNRYPLGQNPQQDELDDSLLDLLDDEDDSEGLALGQEELDDSLLDLTDNEDDSEGLTMGQEELDDSLLVLTDSEDNSCYAAASSEKYERTTLVVTVTHSESENESEKNGASLCKTLNATNTLTEESESEGDRSNYAAMPLSPTKSAVDPVEGIKPKQPSVCNVTSPEFLTAGTVMDSDLPTPLSDGKEVPAALLWSSSSPALLLPSVSLSKVDAAIDWTEDPDLAFDCDIDNLLAISPGTVFSSDEDNGVGSAAITTNGNCSRISDSTLPPPNIESDQVLKANATSSDAAQDLPPLSLDTVGLPRVHHHHPPPHPTEPEPPSTSSILTTESKLSTKSSGTEQNIEPQKPSEAEETKGIPNAESTSRSTDLSPNSAPRANGNQSKTVAPSNCKAKASVDPGKENPITAAAPRTSFRTYTSDFELEINKDYYCERVLMHIEGQGECNLDDPRSELASLQNHISWENQDWPHPSNFTKRNHPRSGNKPSKRITLQQWVAKNGGPSERFKNFPATFQRSLIPGSLPS
ncbi:S100P-binding protein isoform X2 [Eleutherodactylus coqui]